MVQDLVRNYSQSSIEDVCALLKIYCVTKYLKRRSWQSHPDFCKAILPSQLLMFENSASMKH